jgi:RNA-directed DNA polymerase
LLLQILYRKIKCKETMRLIRRWLRVPILLDGKLVKRRKGMPQGSPLSPLLSNIMLHELDMEMERRKLRFVRYADDLFTIFLFFLSVFMTSLSLGSASTAKQKAKPER